jgi:Tol biopolymer transport system component/imidazolonepropionase-like amidohydrolase
MHPKTSKFKLTTSRLRWMRSLAAVCIASVALFVMVPLLTQANLLDRPAKEVTITFTEGTNMAAAPSPDGETIILAIQSSLWSMPINGGDAKQLTGWQVEATWPVWAPDGSRIAFQNFSDNTYHIWTIAPDGSDLRQITSGLHDHREPSWSPDGRKIAFSSDRSENGSYDIWTIDLQTGAYEQRTNMTTEEHSPAWSPDGTRIAYVEGRFVFAVDLLGQREELASVPTGTAQAPAWLPNGEGVVYQNNNRQIVLDGQVVTSGEDVFPFPVRWLPDGRLIYTADGKIRVRNADGGDPNDIAFRAALTVRRPVTRRSNDHGFDDKDPRPVLGLPAPSLSPDGEMIAFVALNDLWVMRIGRKPVRLTDDKFVDWDPKWSRDGNRIYFASDRHGNGSPQLYSIELSTGEVTQISNIADQDVVTPALAPDEKSFAYITADQELMIYDIATAQSRKLADQAGGGPTIGAPTWSPDGETIALADFRRINGRFREGYHMLRTVDVATGASALYHVSTPPDQIQDRNEAGPVWSPDGKWMAFIMNATLHVVPVDLNGAPTGRPMQLTDHAADMPSWSGDSGTILYVSNGKLKTIQLDGTGQKNISLDLTWTQAVPRGRTIIHAGALWDGINPAINENVDIVIAGNRIREVRPHKDHAIEPGDRLIDASDLTVMPGLWDPHVHPRLKDAMGPLMAIWLAYGITSVTSVGNVPYHTVFLKEALEAGNMVGPRLFSSGPTYEGARVFYSQNRVIKDEQVADLEMTKAKALGLDYLKAYVRTSIRVMAKIAQTAHQMGVPSGTHLISPGFQTGLTGTTHLSATQRMGYSWSQSPGGFIYQDVVEIYTKGSFDLTSTHGGDALLGEDPSMVEDRRFQLLMPRTYVEELLEDAQTPPTAAQRAAILTSVERPARIMRAGGLVTVGTDTPLNSPAFSLHMALRAFALGVSNHEALQSVTINAAKFSRADHELGTVERGKIADLILIRGNPLENVANTANVEIVMKNGLIYTVDDILRLYEGRVSERARNDRRCGANAVPCVASAKLVRKERVDHGH